MRYPLRNTKADPIGSALDTANKPKLTRGDEIEIPSPVARSPYGESVVGVEVAEAKIGQRKCLHLEPQLI